MAEVGVFGWRTRRWRWTELERVFQDPLRTHRDDAAVYVVPVGGRRRPALPWHALGHPVRDADLDRLVLARAAAAGVDTTPPPTRQQLRTGADAGLAPFNEVAN